MRSRSLVASVSTTLVFWIGSENRWEDLGKVGKDTISMLLKPENKKKLQAILKHHVVAGKVMSGTAVKLSEAATLNGTKLGLKFDAKAKKLHVGEGTVVAADVEAKNGVIHVVDSVLLPK